MKNVFLREISSWFTVIKAPQLKDMTMEAVEISDTNGELTEKQKKLLAFMCFSFSMNHGPASFLGVRMVIEDIGVEKEFEEYAKDWIGHSNKSKTPQP